MIDSTPPGGPSTRALRLAAAVLICGALATAALYSQTRALGISRFGYCDLESAFDYIEEGPQWARHADVMQGTALSPWQYRVFSPWVNQMAIDWFQTTGVDHPKAAGFLSVRWVQNFLILGCAAWFYRRLGLADGAVLLGISLLALSMSRAVYDSDLSTNTYFDVLFFLLAGLLVLNDRRLWVVPVVAVAAFNRETSALIPALVLVGGLRPGGEGRPGREKLVIAAAGWCVFTVVFLGVRAVLGERELFEPYGISVGLERLFANLTSSVGWLELTLTFGLVPLLSIAALSVAPRVLRDIWFLIVPAWIAVHLVVAVAAETRLFLVPMALVFIPCVLFLVVGRSQTPPHRSEAENDRVV